MTEWIACGKAPMNMTDIIVRLSFGGAIFIFTVMLIAFISSYFKRRLVSGQKDRAPAELTATAKKEKRQHQRADIMWPVKMKTSQGTVEAQIKNISLGGAFICCHKPLPLSERFRLTIDAPSHDALTVNAEVIWSNINVPDERIVNRGMGIRFIKITKDDREFVNKAISTYFDSSVG